MTTMREELDLDGGAIATAFAIERTYADGGPFQWAVEIYRNVTQLKSRMTEEGLDTSKVELRFDFVQTDVLAIGDHPEAESVIATPIKRRAWNIGKPMDPENELLKFYSKINVGGGKNRWSLTNLDGSYGMGVRASTLPWTDVTFITTVPGDGSYAITLRGVEDEDGNPVYRIVRPLLFDEDGDAIVGDPLVKLAASDEEETYYVHTSYDTCVALTEDLVHEQVRKHGGVSLVMLGRGDYTWNVELDELPVKSENPKGLSRVLTDRFIGGDFPVSVAYTFVSKSTERVHGAGSFDMLDGTKIHYDARALKTLADWTDRADQLDDVFVDAHGTHITSYLLPEDFWHERSLTTEEKTALVEKDPTVKTEYRSDGTWGVVKDTKDSWFPFYGKGTAVVQYGTEMYAVRETGESWSNVLSKWGISDDRVGRSTLLVIHAPIQDSIHSETWGITQNSARSNVTGPNGTDLPFNTWQNAWLDNFPAKLQDRLKVHPPTTSREIPEEEIARLMVRAFGAHSPRTKKDLRTVVADDKDTDITSGEADDGEITTSAGHGKGKGGGGAAHKTSTTAHAKKRGKVKVVNRNPKLPDPPQPEFLTPEQWAEREFDPEQFVHVHTVGTDYGILLNGGHKLMERQIEYYWTDERKGYFSVAARKRIRDAIYRMVGGRRGGGEAKAELAVRTEIEYVYRHDALANFLGAQAVYADGKGNIDRTAFNDMITNGSMAMTVGMVGIYPQHSSIADRINGLASSGR